MTPPIAGPGEGLNSAVAAELRAERAAQNMTVKELATTADVPFASLRRYLAAERHIDMAVLESLAGALGLDPSELVQRAVERRNRDATVIRFPSARPDVSGEEVNLVDLYDEPSAAHPVPRQDVEGDVDPDLQ